MSRLKVERSGPNSLRMIIPVSPDPLVLMFYILLSTVALVGEFLLAFLVVGVMVSGSNEIYKEHFLMVMFCFFWTGVYAWSLRTTIWYVCGREEIDADVTHLALSRIAFHRVVRRYETSKVTNLRVQPFRPNPWDRWEGLLQFSGLIGGSVAFDYRDRVVHFGDRLTDVEASEVISTLESVSKNADVPPSPP